ncbi:MAG TPA: type II toxin-antitoxin system ParD family antitoxin [Terriglobia bacterium]|nr:type II toxin-antitoxin system ParD family antitoxin [Terriglobia bacterium]
MNMAIEQMNISLSPHMASFIRGKVKKGEYASASEVVRDAVRRMQEAEVGKRERALTEFESHLTKSQREGIRRSIEEGIRDLEEGRYKDYDAEGLRALAKEVVNASAKKLARRQKAR